MEYTMLVILLFCAAVPFATGLQCYTCTDIHMESDNDELNAFLNGIIPRDEACGADDISGIKQETCTGASGGKVVKCLKTKGTASATLKGQSLTVRTTERGCTVVDEDAKDDCETTNDMSLAKATPGMQTVKVENFEAAKCLCEDDNCNGQTTLAPALITCLLSLALVIARLW